jgi:hypothetical protein
VDQVGLQRLEAAREGYIKVVELFVGEILVREGEWEMARAFLEGESVSGSKRKEVCHTARYRRGAVLASACSDQGV